MSPVAIPPPVVVVAVVVVVVVVVEELVVAGAVYVPVVGVAPATPLVAVVIEPGDIPVLLESSRWVESSRPEELWAYSRPAWPLSRRPSCSRVRELPC